MLTPDQIKAIAKRRGDTLVNPNGSSTPVVNPAEAFAQRVGFKPQPPKDESTIGERIKPQLDKRLANIDKLKQENVEGKRGFLGSSVLVGGQVAGAGAEIVEEGIKTAAKKVWDIMPDREKAVFRFVGDALKTGAKAVGDIKTADGFTVSEQLGAAGKILGENYDELKRQHPEVMQYVEAGGNVARLAMDASLVENLANAGFKGAKNVTTAVKEEAKAAVDITKKAGTAIAGGIEKLPVEETIQKVLPKPEDIMNRVARLTPKQAQKFEQLAGKTHGQYLKETGNFGTPQEIVTNEATKFANSIKEVDGALATLPGKYKSTHLKTLLSDLIKREKQIGVANSETSVIKDLANKYKSGGLSMSEINEAKRIYERTVKLGYLKEQNAVGIARSTRIDSALREWQVKTATDLGFKNLPALNKQTQLSKYLIDKLGGELMGKTGNNAVTLTDWIILSGGDPMAIGAFFAKKLISAKGFQAGVAKLLTKEAPLAPIKAEFSPGTTRTGMPPTK